MVIDKILIYGSTPLTEDVVNLISQHYTLVGHVPSKNPFLKGNINLPIVSEDTPHDIKLSLQYDSKISNIDNAFNIHTGILPEWGGTNILYNTLKESSKEQGLTFHKMGPTFDFGEIISKITYPVLSNDTMISLYKRMVSISPLFVLNSLQLLETLSSSEVQNCYKSPPRLFKRSQVDDEDIEMFKSTGEELKQIWNLKK